MKHLLGINGLNGPLARILGCHCGRCTSPTRQAHISAFSLTAYSYRSAVTTSIRAA